MSAAGTAHQKVTTLLSEYAPSPLFDAVYTTHQKANLVVPSISVEVETDTPLIGDAALVQQELVDNREIRLSLRIHMNYRKGVIDTDNTVDIVDSVIRWLREHIDLSGSYRIFEVTGVAYNVEHTSSGTVGAEITINIHKVEFYEQI